MKGNGSLKCNLSVMRLFCHVDNQRVAVYILILLCQVQLCWSIQPCFHADTSWLKKTKHIEKSDSAHH